MTAKTMAARLRLFPARSTHHALLIVLFAFIASALVTAFDASPARATTMSHDPNGFHGILWGSPLNESQFSVSHPGTRISDYRLKEGRSRFADTDVDSIMFSTVDNQFARVTIRYRGENTHKKVLAYLEQTYGEIDRLPGQMTRGLNQQYNWRGPETEINLTYEGNLERGYIFIESRTLSPRFNDGLTDTGG
jgi:hypothetical protein